MDSLPGEPATLAEAEAADDAAQQMQQADSSGLAAGLSLRSSLHEMEQADTHSSSLTAGAGQWRHSSALIKSLRDSRAWSWKVPLGRKRIALEASRSAGAWASTSPLTTGRIPQQPVVAARPSCDRCTWVVPGPGRAVLKLRCGACERHGELPVIPFEAAIFAERLAHAPVSERPDPPVPYVLSDLPAVRRPPRGLLALLPQVLQGVACYARRCGIVARLRSRADRRDCERLLGG